MEIRIIGRYVPEEFWKERIETEIRAYLPSCCKNERIGIRVPGDINPHPDNLQWHQDGGGPLGNTCHMVVWASANPTELMMSDGQLFVQAPYDVVWYDNYVVRHRWPVMGAINPGRWFLGVRCSNSNLRGEDVKEYSR